MGGEERGKLEARGEGRKSPSISSIAIVCIVFLQLLLLSHEGGVGCLYEKQKRKDASGDYFNLYLPKLKVTTDNKTSPRTHLLLDLSSNDYDNTTM